MWRRHAAPHARKRPARSVGPVAGVQIAVAHDGNLAFVDSFGLADAAEHRPLGNDTVFHIASISKNILAAVVVRLAEERRLSLGDEVTRYVASAPTHGARITVRQLLNHTSGLYSFTARPDAEANEQKVLSHQQVIELFKDHPLDFPPGSSGGTTTPPSISPAWSSRRSPDVRMRTTSATRSSARSA